MLPEPSKDVGVNSALLSPSKRGEKATATTPPTTGRSSPGANDNVLKRGRRRAFDLGEQPPESLRSYKEGSEFVWGQLARGAVLVGFLAYHGGVPVMFAAFVIVAGFRIHEERFQLKWCHFGELLSRSMRTPLKQILATSTLLSTLIRGSPVRRFGFTQLGFTHTVALWQPALALVQSLQFKIDHFTCRLDVKTPVVRRRVPVHRLLLSAFEV